MNGVGSSLFIPLCNVYHMSVSTHFQSGARRMLRPTIEEIKSANMTMHYLHNSLPLGNKPVQDCHVIITVKM